MKRPVLARVLLRLYPRAFRERYGPEIEATWAAELAGAGPGRRAWIRVRGAVDLLAGALREWIRRGREGGGMGTITADLRYAVRSLTRRPGLTGAAVLTLALGIGSVTAVFSLVNGLLLRPLPYPDADRLVHVWSEHRERGWRDLDVTLPDAWAWRQRTDAFQEMAAFSYVGITDESGEVPDRIDGVWSTWNLFDVLEVEPVLGRGFVEEDGREGAPTVVLVSHGYWMRMLGGDPDAVGRTVVLNGRPRTIVGVLPPEFRFLAMDAQVFTPWQGNPADGALNEHGWQALGRLAPGVDLATADRIVNEVSDRMATEHPESHEGMTARLVTLRREVAGDVAPRAAWIMLGAVLFVLLMACVNVANLLLAKGADRAGEMAVRAALGAGRGRLVRQLFVEALLLAGTGGGLGLLLARFGRDGMVAGLPDNLPPVFRFPLDLRVLGFALVVTLGSALVFGLLPAFRVSAPARALRRHGRGGTGVVGGGLVVVQTALAVLLLIGASVTARSVVAMARQEMGWDADGVLTARLSPRRDRYPGAEEVEAFHDAVLAEVRALPGVEAAGAIQSIPLQGGNTVGTVAPTSGTGEPDDWTVRISYVSPGYMEAMRLQVIRGRGIVAADGAESEAVALVNETFVERYLSGDEAVGTSLAWGRSETPIRIVGVVEDHIERSVDRPVEPSLYLPLARYPTWTRTLAVRSAGGTPEALVSGIREAVARVDPGVAVFQVRTMGDLVDLRIGGFTLIAQVMLTFGLLSLVLGAVGIYGVVSHHVARRTREIGVRLVLGAEPGDVRRTVVRQGLGRIGAGIALGLALAIPLAGVLRGVVVGVDPRSPIGFLGAALVLLAVGGVGAWLPARRASRVDPARALAAE